MTVLKSFSNIPFINSLDQFDGQNDPLIDPYASPYGVWEGVLLKLCILRHQRVILENILSFSSENYHNFDMALLKFVMIVNKVSNS